MSADRARKEGMNGGNAVHLSNLKIINGCIAFDICSGKFHRVSESAAFVISELKRQTPLGKLVSSYSRRYQISPSVAARDVELFLNDISVIR
ncbi:MAG: PqqD family protein [Xanthobacteraceae bacterium]